MDLHPATNSALDAWVLKRTWHTNHRLDKNDFYDFVNAYAAEHGPHLPEDDLRDEIIRRQPKPLTDALSEILDERISLAVDILEFLEHTGRANESHVER